MLPIKKHIAFTFAVLCLSACEPEGKHDHDHKHDGAHNHEETNNIDKPKAAQSESQNTPLSNTIQSSIDSIVALFDEESISPF